MRFTPLKKIGFLIGLCLCTLNAEAATQITLTCTAPATRTDGSPFATTDLASFLFGLIPDPTKPATPLATKLPPSPQSLVIPIPANTCIKAGTVYGCAVSDSLGQLSDLGTATLPADACNYLPKPAKPTVTITVQ